MAENRGKQFEECIKRAFENVPGVSVDRLYDPMAGYSGIKNICDFIVYKEPHQYYIECKSVHGGTLPYSNITPTQWQGLLAKSKIPGVIAGVICWWVDKDATFFIPIEALEIGKTVFNEKSVKLKECYEDDLFIEISGKKKRVFFEYDMSQFFNEVE